MAKEVHGERLYSFADIERMLVFGELMPDFRGTGAWINETTQKILERESQIPETDHKLTGEAALQDAASRAYRLGFNRATELLAKQPEPVSAGDWIADRDRGADEVVERLREDGIRGLDNVQGLDTSGL
jgi:hypothetical protein